MTYNGVMLTKEQALANGPSTVTVEVSERRVPDLPQDFAQWHRDHRAAVYCYVRFRVATRETAEDVT